MTKNHKQKSTDKEEKNSFCLLLNNNKKPFFCPFSCKTPNPNCFLLFYHKKLLYMEETLHKLLLRQQNKYSYEDIEYCYNLLNEKPFITVDTIKNNEILKEKYNRPEYQNTLLNYLLSNKPDLAKIKMGTGNKKYIYKKGNEGAVKHLIRNSKSKGKITTKENIYQSIKQHILDLPQESILTDKLMLILKDDFEIKQAKRRREILKRLKRDGVIRSNQHSTGFDIIRS